jgi:hypothetical protein
VTFHDNPFQHLFAALESAGEDNDFLKGVTASATVTSCLFVQGDASLPTLGWRA